MKKPKIKIIELEDCFDIVLTLDGTGGGSIVSNLHEDDDAGADLYNAAIDGIESMVLAHACAGIDVSTPAYMEGIETAVMAVSNNYPED